MSTRKFNSLAGLALFGAVAIFVGLMLIGQDENRFHRAGPPTSDSVTPTPVSAEGRAVYRHSIVRGGVYSGREARAAAREDRVVGNHYRDVHFTKLRPVSLEQPVDRYVSFRRQDKVYWTRRRMRVPAGEVVLSDGESMVRARCGNRLSETPQEPTVPAGSSEPDDAELSTVDERISPRSVANGNVAGAQLGKTSDVFRAAAGTETRELMPVAILPTSKFSSAEEGHSSPPSSPFTVGGMPPESQAGTAGNPFMPVLPAAEIPQFVAILQPPTDPSVRVVIPVTGTAELTSKPDIRRGTPSPVGGTELSSGSRTEAETSPSGTTARSGGLAARYIAGSFPVSFGRPETQLLAAPSDTLSRGGGFPGLIVQPGPNEEFRETPEPGTWGICAFAFSLAVIRTRRSR